MTLQQLRYLIAVAEHGSINAAARNLYTAQSNVSCAMRDLEEEFGFEIFTRSNRGVELTAEGTELLGYARQVIEQADMLEERFIQGSAPQERLAVSAQHYAFSVQAFVDVVKSCSSPEYDFVMRETATGAIISDVRDFRSEIGILYLDGFNRPVLEKAFEDARLDFHPLFDAPVHVFVGEQHPLAEKNLIQPEDLEPYPRYSFEQGTENSFYYSEEPLSQLPHRKTIRYSDRGTLTSLLTHFDGYTLSTGVLSDEMQSGIVSVPLAGAPTMRVGYVIHRERRPSALLSRYIERLREIIRTNSSECTYLEDDAGTR